MSSPGDDNIREKIRTCLRNTSPLSALEISKRIGISKKDTNRVVYSMERKHEVEIANPSETRPQWRLASSSSSHSSPGAVGGIQPSSSTQGHSATRAIASGGSPNMSTELYSKTEVGDQIIFSRVESLTNASSLQTSPELMPPPLSSGVSETASNFNPNLQLQSSNITAVGAVATPLHTQQDREKKKKPKVKLAASFGHHTQEENSAPASDSEPPEVTHVTQESEAPSTAYIGQEMDPADNEHVTQERSRDLADEFSLLTMNSNR